MNYEAGLHSYLRQFSGITPDDHKVSNAEWDALPADAQREYMRLCENSAYELMKLLELIPPCSAHGEHCLPHAADWIRSRQAPAEPDDAQARVQQLEAALRDLLGQVEHNCLDVLAEEAQHYTRMGHPNLDRQDAAIYADVKKACDAAAALLDDTAKGDGA